MNNSSKVDYAKQTLKNFVPIVDNELQKIWKKEMSELDIDGPDVIEFSKIMLEHAREHNMRPAKRLRSAFIYYIYKLLGGKDEAAILNASTSIEFVHTALLMHDDFMDKDEIRRGQPTTHIYFKNFFEQKNFKGDAAHFGYSMALDIGDIILTLGYRMISDANFEDRLKIKAMHEILNGIIKTGYGQAYDAYLESRPDFTEENIINLHFGKTSIYTYQTPILLGAILAGASDTDIDILTKYAKPGGIAFQLQDDILGLFGDEEKTGKSSFADLRQGKKTLLILKALEKADPTQKKIIESYWGNPDITAQNAEEVRKVVIDTGSLQYSYQIAQKFALESRSIIPKMREKNWESSVIDFLDGIAEYMARDREN